MGDTTEANTKVLSGELFLGVVVLQTPIQKNHYMSKMGTFLKYGHKHILVIPMCVCKKNNNPANTVVLAAVQVGRGITHPPIVL